MRPPCSNSVELGDLLAGIDMKKLDLPETDDRIIGNREEENT